MTKKVTISVLTPAQKKAWLAVHTQRKDDPKKSIDSILKSVGCNWSTWAQAKKRMTSGKAKRSYVRKEKVFTPVSFAPVKPDDDKVVALVGSPAMIRKTLGL